jgi:hypothetical protein
VQVPAGEHGELIRDLEPGVLKGEAAGPAAGGPDALPAGGLRAPRRNTRWRFVAETSCRALQREIASSEIVN